MTAETKFTVGEYKTRDGHRARVYATDGYGTYSIHGAVFMEDTHGWHANKWSIYGESNMGLAKKLDLMPPLREWWIVAGQVWDNEREAIESIAFLHSGVKPIHVREVRDDQA